MTTTREDISDLLNEVWIAKSLPAPAEAARIRQGASVTQARLAKTLGVDRTTIARWEAGTSRPRPQQRAKWAAVLNALRDAVE